MHVASVSWFVGLVQHGDAIQRRDAEFAEISAEKTKNRGAIESGIHAAVRGGAQRKESVRRALRTRRRRSSPALSVN